jgi:hypothetical protein
MNPAKGDSVQKPQHWLVSRSDNFRYREIKTEAPCHAFCETISERKLKHASGAKDVNNTPVYGTVCKVVQVIKTAHRQKAFVPFVTFTVDLAPKGLGLIIPIFFWENVFLCFDAHFKARRLVERTICFAGLSS